MPRKTFTRVKSTDLNNPWRFKPKHHLTLQDKENKDYYKTFQRQCFCQKKLELQPWLVWLSRLSARVGTKRWPVQVPSRSYAWVAGQMSGLQARSPVGGVGDAIYQCISHTLMFLSSLSPFPLSKNKKIKLKKKNPKTRVTDLSYSRIKHVSQGFYF